MLRKNNVQPARWATLHTVGRTIHTTRRCRIRQHTCCLPVYSCLLSRDYRLLLGQMHTDHRHITSDAVCMPSKQQVITWSFASIKTERALYKHLPSCTTAALLAAASRTHKNHHTKALHHKHQTQTAMLL
jgi:hypothetical protein